MAVFVSTNKVITLKISYYNNSSERFKYLFFDINSKNKHTISFGNYTPFKYNLSKITYHKNDYQFKGTDFHCEIDSNFAIKNLTRINPTLKKHANFKDVSGNIWLGGLETGVHFIPANKRNTSIYHKNKKVRNFVVNNQQLNYILDNTFLCRFTNYSPEIWLKEKNYIEHIFSIDKHLTIHHKNKTISNNNYNQVSPLFYSSKRNVLIDSNIFTINSSGFYKVSIPEFLNADSSKKIKYSDLYTVIINDIIKHKDTLFVATNNGLFYFKNEELIRHPTNFTSPIQSLGVSKNILLLGTSEYGLATYLNGKITNLKSKFTTESLQVFQDSIILVSTKKGMYHYIHQDSITLRHRFTINDGLPTDHVLDASLYRDSLYIGTTKGLAVMPFETIKTKAINPFYVEQVLWNDNPTQELSIESPFRINNSIEVDYKSIKYELKNYDTYSYRLLPSQTKFQELPTGHVHIRNLPIGENTLELKITNCHGVEFIKKIPIIITPKLYQRAWFTPLIVFSVLILTFFYLRHQRIKRTNKDLFKAKKREELANFKLESLRSQMNPHFVFNSLNAIQYYINESDTIMSEKYLIKFSKLIRQYFDLSSEKDITIGKEIELLHNYLMLEKMRFDPNLNFSIEIKNDLDKTTTKIPTMLIQPIVENAVNHGIFHKGEVGKVEVIFEKIDKNTFKTIISDDGIGIENSQKLKKRMVSGHNSKSTIIFKKRVDLLNESKFWKIKYSIKNSSSDLNFPGTEVTLYITKL